MTRRSLVLVATLVVCGCSPAADAGGDAGAPAHVVSASTALATTQRFVETEDALGVVAPRSGHVAALSAPAAARVIRVYVTVGAAVRRGDPLVDFERSVFDATAQSAEAALEAAQKAAERAQRLADAGVLPRKDAEQAKAEVARLSAEAVNARRMLQLSSLRSPIGGVVTRANVALGASVDPAQVLVEIADPSALDVVLTLSPPQAARVRRGAAVDLHPGADAREAAVGTGRVRDISLAVDSATRGVPIRVEIVRSTQQLLIGQNLFARTTVAVYDKAVVIPAAALVPEGDGFKVFVVDAEGIAHSRPVTVGGRTDTLVRIASGLSGGERVVTDGAYGVEDSSKVAPGKS